MLIATFGVCLNADAKSGFAANPASLRPLLPLRLCAKHLPLTYMRLPWLQERGLKSS